MKRWIAWMLVLMLLAGGALAEMDSAEKQRVYDLLGICSIDAYAGQRIEYFDYTMDYEVDQWVDRENGLLTWDVLWDIEGTGEMGFGHQGNCFPLQGVIGEADYDLDGDGCDEWVVLHNSGENGQELWLQVYEREGQRLSLADEVCLTDWFTYYVLYQSAFMAQLNGKPRLVFVDGILIDGPAMNLYILEYSDGRLSANEQLSWFGDECGELNIQRCDAITIQDKRIVYGEQIEEEGGQQGAEWLEKILKKRGFAWEDSAADGEWGDWYRIVSAPKQTTLHAFDLRGQRDGQNRPVARLQFTAPGLLIETTGSVNLRALPSLDGEKLAAVPQDTALIYAHMQQTDERGVIWYAVEYEGQTCWVSSKYAELN